MNRIYVRAFVGFFVYNEILYSSAALTEVFPCFFLSCKVNARVYLAKTGHGPHFSQILCCSVYCLCRFCCSVYSLFVNVYLLLSPGAYPIAVKYISYHVSYIIYIYIYISYHISLLMFSTVPWHISRSLPPYSVTVLLFLTSCNFMHFTCHCKQCCQSGALPWLPYESLMCEEHLCRLVWVSEVFFFFVCGK
jgi:hypothetical protein